MLFIISALLLLSPLSGAQSCVPTADNCGCLDLITIVDGSGSMGQAYYDITHFVADTFVFNINVQPSGNTVTHMAMYVFASQNIMADSFGFYNYTNPCDMQTAILSWPDPGGGTNAVVAFELAYNMFYTQSRPGTQKAIAFYSDGGFSAASTWPITSAIRSQFGATIVSIGVSPYGASSVNTAVLANVSGTINDVLVIDQPSDLTSNLNNILNLLPCNQNVQCNAVYSTLSGTHYLTSTPPYQPGECTAFLLDKSGSISPNIYSQTMQCIANGVAQGVNYLYRASWMVMDFSTYANMECYPTCPQIVSVLQNEQAGSGETRLYNATQYAGHQIKSLCSSGMPMTLFIVSDGDCDDYDCSPQDQQAAQQAIQGINTASIQFTNDKRGRNQLAALTNTTISYQTSSCQEITNFVSNFIQNNAVNMAVGK